MNAVGAHVQDSTTLLALIQASPRPPPLRADPARLYDALKHISSRHSALIIWFPALGPPTPNSQLTTLCPHHPPPHRRLVVSCLAKAAVTSRNRQLPTRVLPPLRTSDWPWAPNGRCKWREAYRVLRRSGQSRAVINGHTNHATTGTKYWSCGLVT